MAKAKKKEVLTLEEKLEQALVSVEEQPYEVPINWCFFRFTSLIDIEGGTQPPKSQFEEEPRDGYVRLVQIRDFASDKYMVYVPDTKKLRKFSKTDIMIARYGASVGRICTGLEGAYNVALAKTIFSEKVLNREYVYWMLQSETFQNPLASISRSAQAGFNKEDLYKFTMPLPPLAEQQRIVEKIEDLFAKLDETKEKLQDILGNSEERKSAILYKAYSGALTEEWRKQNGKSLGEWQEVCLKEVCKINPPKINAKDYNDDMEVSFFPMSALSEVTGTITEPQTRRLDEVKNGFTNFSEGDVVFAKITPCMENGKSAIIGKLVNDIGYGTTEFYVLRCSDRLVNGYLYYLVRSKRFRDEAKSVMTGAVGQQRVPKAFLEDYKLNLPSPEEQAEILTIVNDAVHKEQQIVTNCENVIEQIDMMKKTILAKAFRGKLGTNNPNEESAVELLKSILE